ncbi:unnamed protein product [Lampetra fluviatilis]
MSRSSLDTLHNLAMGVSSRDECQEKATRPLPARRRPTRDDVCRFDLIMSGQSRRSAVGIDEASLVNGTVSRSVSTQQNSYPPWRSSVDCSSLGMMGGGGIGSEEEWGVACALHYNTAGPDERVVFRVAGGEKTVREIPRRDSGVATSRHVPPNAAGQPSAAPLESSWSSFLHGATRSEDNRSTAACYHAPTMALLTREEPNSIDAPQLRNSRHARRRQLGGHADPSPPRANVAAMTPGAPLDARRDM